MAEFLVYMRLKIPEPPPDLPAPLEPLPPSEPTPKLLQAALVEADNEQAAVEQTLAFDFFHGADSVFVLPLADASEYALTHTHIAEPA